MKKILAFMAFACVFAVGCMSMQKTDPALVEKPFQYVYVFDGVKKDAIYDKSLGWFAETYNSSNEVLQLKDKANGKIIGRGAGEFYCAMWLRKYSYTVKLEIKDGKSRLTFDGYKPETYIGTNPLSGEKTEVGGMGLDYQEPYDLVKVNFDKLSAKYNQYIKAKEDSF